MFIPFNQPRYNTLRGPKCPYQWGVCIRRVGFKENVKAFFPQGLSKLSVMMRCPYPIRRVTLTRGLIIVLVISLSLLF